MPFLSSALYLVLFALGLYYDGIYEFYEFSFLDFYYHYAAKHSDLRRGKTDAVGFMKSVRHIVEQTKRSAGYDRHGFAYLAESLVSVFYYYGF